MCEHFVVLQTYYYAVISQYRECLVVDPARCVRQQLLLATSGSTPADLAVTRSMFSLFGGWRALLAGPASHPEQQVIQQVPCRQWSRAGCVPAAALLGAAAVLERPSSGYSQGWMPVRHSVCGATRVQYAF